MNPSEKNACEFLRSRFPDETVIYEPDGNCMPDFLVSQGVAVEVRRLNQNVYDGSKFRGLEELSKPVKDQLREVLESFGPSDGCKSWFVFFTMSPQQVRQIPGLKKEVKRLLNQFLNSADKSDKHEVTLCDFPKSKFRLGVLRSSNSYHSLFVLGSYQDWRRGGFVLSELERNISICVNEKTEKLKNSESMDKYPEWWLVLDDHIDGDLDDGEMEELRQLIRVPPEWARIVVLNSSHNGLPLEVCR